MEEAVKIGNYISIKKNRIIDSSLPEGVKVEGMTIIFDSPTPITLKIDLDLSECQCELHYHFLKGTKTELIETRYAAQTGTLKRKVSVDQDAKLAVLVLDESTAKITVEDHFEIEARAKVESAYAELSLSDVEAKYFYHLLGNEADAKIKMAALSNAEYRKHFEVSLLHSAMNSYGEMSNYGVVKDQGRLIIDGIGKIEKGMSQSSTHQTSKIIVFDSNCVAQANPYLYIDEYDVKASHAAGVGRMDEEHLFYLQSRGLTKAQAMRLITYGYLIPVIDVIDNDTVKEAFNKTLEKRMGD